MCKLFKFRHIEVYGRERTYRAGRTPIQEPYPLSSYDAYFQQLVAFKFTHYSSYSQIFVPLFRAFLTSLKENSNRRQKKPFSLPREIHLRGEGALLRKHRKSKAPLNVAGLHCRRPQGLLQTLWKLYRQTIRTKFSGRKGPSPVLTRSCTDGRFPRVRPQTGSPCSDLNPRHTRESDCAQSMWSRRRNPTSTK